MPTRKDAAMNVPGPFRWSGPMHWTKLRDAARIAGENP